MKTATLLLAAVALGPLASAARAQEDDSTRFFALPDVRDTRELAAVAEEHLHAERFPEAIQALQRILEDHAQEVLPAERAGLESRSTHPGAAEWALQRLFALPEQARAAYRERYEPRAAEALARARREPERSSLAAVTRQWPLAPSAVHAWFALGDLELESGHGEAAELAWQHALALGAELGLALDAELAPRREWLRARGEQRAAARPPRASLPRGDGEPTWTRSLDLTPFVRRNAPLIGKNLQPLSTGDLVLVSTTLRVFALDAFTGDIRWEAGPPRGWSTVPLPGVGSQLFEGINHDQLFLTPAVGDGIALAVLQEPFTENENEEWQGIPIMTAIPERRLHAYELETGRELWNHAPALTGEGLRLRWDGGGTYAQRMMVAGSPTVAGARVLVPCYRMQGRIDYHVACYELASGELLWSTLVISGQRERNMFGRSVSEFSASPLVVAGDRVIAQTELGTLASLDLFSGRIQWQTTYPQIPLPKTRSYTPPKRPLTWRLAPPAVVGDLLIATPSDSNEIVALRVQDGKKLWEYKEEQLQGLDPDTELAGFNLLLGADQDTIYLSGAKLSALQKPGGLASTAFFVPRWTQELGDRGESAPRAVLAADAVLAPGVNERTAFDRRTGKPIAALSGGWKGGEPGTVWLDEGALFSLSSQGISGYFDWQAQLERARRLASSGADEAHLRAAADLFLRRGTLSLAEGSLEAARGSLEEARALFARLRALAPRSDAQRELSCARSLAEVLARLQRDAEALAVLSEARPLAASRADLAALLFQEERILRGRGGAERVAVLDAIESCWGELPLPDEARAEATFAWLGAASAGEALEIDPAPLPTALWVAVERAGERERAGELALALEDLHHALALARGLVLARGFPLPSVVIERIARVLALPGGHEAYAALEQRASELLSEARAADDERRMGSVAELYPHSRAADEALAFLLEQSLSGGDARAVVELVRTALARGGLSPERETELLLYLARALGQHGNAPLERGLVAALARVDPARTSPLPDHGGLTLAALAAELGKEDPAPGPVAVRFDKDVVSTGKQRQGTTEFLGVLRPQGVAAESAPLELHLYATRDELLAFASDAPGTPAWTRPLDQPLEPPHAGAGPRCAFAPGRFVHGTRDGLACLDERGVELWTRVLDDDPARAVAEANGVVVARLRSGLVLACDAQLGLPLWDKALGTTGNWTGPLLGEGYAVFFSQIPALPPRALVLDLFRGRVTADIRLTGFDSRSALEHTAWIASGRLIAPSFQLRPSQLAAFGLEGGRRAWMIEFGRDEELQAVAHSEGRAYPITLAAALGSNGNGGVYELDVQTGTLRRIVPLRPGERVMGLGSESERSATLAAPYLFTFTYSESERNVPIRAVHLPFGILWTLPIGSQEIYDGRNLPMPAVSADCVAIGYQTRRASGGQSAEATIVFVDKRAGKKVDTLILGGAFSQATRLELRGLGESLFVLGKGMPRGGCLEILERQR